jgi:hypothetical protein
LLADFGYVEPPLEGCPVRTPDLERYRLNQIVGDVIEELRGRTG